jgi:ABC-2 type transport system ATP-binding protein
MSPAIRTTELSKRYGSHTALHGLDLTIEPGTVFGLIRPTGGTARVLGEDPRTAGPALRRRIGFVPGELRLEGRVKGRALLNHFADISGPVAPGAIDGLADRLGLDLSRQVRHLSKGNKQKLGLVQAFMHSPELLVLDEPTSGLDPLVQREFMAMVREARDNGQTVLLSSHVLSEIQQTADVVAVLSQGRVVAEGAVESLRLASIRRVRAGLADTTEDAVRTALGKLTHLKEVDVRTVGEIVRLTATVNGDIDAVVKEIARHRVVDLAVEEPDLEESVLSLYGAKGEEADRA